MEQFTKEALSYFESSLDEGDHLVECFYYKYSTKAGATRLLIGLTEKKALLWHWEGTTEDLDPLLMQLTEEYLDFKSKHLADAKAKEMLAEKEH